MLATRAAVLYPVAVRVLRPANRVAGREAQQTQEQNRAHQAAVAGVGAGVGVALPEPLEVEFWSFAIWMPR